MIQEIKCPYCSKVYCRVSQSKIGAQGSTKVQYFECCDTRRKIVAAQEMNKPITYLDDNRNERRLKKDTPL